MSFFDVIKDYRTIIKLKTSYWRSDRGLHSKRDIIYCKTLSYGHNILYEDSNNVSAQYVFERIINFHECLDNVLYEVVACNLNANWETGICEEYDYKLIPFIEEENEKYK